MPTTRTTVSRHLDRTRRTLHALRWRRLAAASDAAFRRWQEGTRLAGEYQAAAGYAAPLPEEIRQLIDKGERDYGLANEAMCEFEARIRREGGRR